MISIKVERIKMLREQKNLSQAKLASLSNLGKRQIQRLEQQTGEVNIREETLKRLAKGLRVERAVLTGDAPLPPTNSLLNTGVAHERNIKLNARVQLHYDLIKQVYKASFEDVVNIAPILFTMIAEKSLSWREKNHQQKIKKVTDLIELTQTFTNLEKTIGTTSDEWSDYLSGHDGLLEAESIKSKDVFGNMLAADADPWWENPLVQYLKEELSDPRWTGKLELLEMDGAPFGVCDYIDDFHVPVMNICETELERIAGFVPDALFALKTGRVRLESIPIELHGPEKTAERSKWIAAHLYATNEEE